MSLLAGENVPSVIEEIARRFPRGSRIMLQNLGRFGKALRLETEGILPFILCGP